MVQRKFDKCLLRLSLFLDCDRGTMHKREFWFTIFKRWVRIADSYPNGNPLHPTGYPWHVASQEGLLLFDRLTVLSSVSRMWSIFHNTLLFALCFSLAAVSLSSHLAKIISALLCSLSFRYNEVRVFIFSACQNRLRLCFITNP